MITEHAFDRDYTPIENKEGILIRNHADDQPLHHVWTIVEGDDESLYALAGFHVVDNIGYVVTRNPWVTGDEEAVYLDYAQFREENADAP